MACIITGITEPTLADGTCDYYATPNLEQSKLYVYPLKTCHVVKTIIRNRLRKCVARDKLQLLEKLFMKPLPEFSCYTVKRIYEAVEEISQAPLDSEFSSNMTCLSDSTFDMDRYYQMCQQYPGEGSITKRHIVKVLFLTSLVAESILLLNISPLCAATNIQVLIRNCREFLDDAEYSNYLREFPWHTWYFPLDTFKITNGEVVRSLVRNRYCKQINFPSVTFHQIREIYVLLLWLFRYELPENTSYQLQCIINEVEDMSLNLDTFDEHYQKWLDNYVPDGRYLTEIQDKALELLKDYPGTDGVLKALLFICLGIEKFFEREYFSSGCKLMKNFIEALGTKPYQEIFADHPWHTWYMQRLPGPSHTVERMANVMPKIYFYPKSEDIKNLIKHS